MYQVCENNGPSYTFGIAGNARLQASAEGLLDRAIRAYQAAGEMQGLFTAFSYRADSWDRARTIIAKAECQSVGTNLRFIVTSRHLHLFEDAERLYDDYVQRGESEHRMDELKNGLHADRLSCHRFCANFWRLLLHVAAPPDTTTEWGYGGSPRPIHVKHLPPLPRPLPTPQNVQASDLMNNPG